MPACASRHDRLTRWLRVHHEEIRLLEVETEQDGVRVVLHCESHAPAKPVEQLAREVAERLQMEADACGHQVRARVVLHLENEHTLSTTIVGRPDLSNTDTPDATGVDALTGGPQSLVVQSQRHNEALVRLMIEKDRQMMSAMGQMLEHVGSIVERALARQTAEEDRADAWREEVAEMRAALEELQGDSEEPRELPPEVKALMGAVTARVLGGGGRTNSNASEN